MAGQFLIKHQHQSQLCPPSKSDPRSRLLPCLCPQFRAQAPAHNRYSVVIEITNKCFLACSSMGMAFLHGDYRPQNQGCKTQ